MRRRDVRMLLNRGKEGQEGPIDRQGELAARSRTRIGDYNFTNCSEGRPKFLAKKKRDVRFEGQGGSWLAARVVI